MSHQEEDNLVGQVGGGSCLQMETIPKITLPLLKARATLEMYFAYLINKSRNNR